ncbi:matrix metalloproteinase-2-like isoform X2 [Haemaphysalis longicornis]
MRKLWRRGYSCGGVYRTTMAKNVKCVSLVLFVCMCCAGVSRPEPTATKKAKMMNFLERFGYMGDTSRNAVLPSDNLRTEQGFRSALKRMQRFAGLSPTGKLDEATMAMMKRPRCGVPDVIGHAERVRRYALQGAKWDKTELTWSVEEFPRRADRNMIRTQIGKALKVWSDASKLRFTEMSSIGRRRRPGDDSDGGADISVSFARLDHGDGYSFDGPGTVLAHAFFPGEGMGGDAHFDADENWITGTPSRDSNEVSLFAVAAHEFGHSLGLSHSSVPGSLMYPYYQGVKEDFQLPYDDKVGIQRLYGAKYPTKWASMQPIIPRTTTSSPGRGPQGRQPPRGGGSGREPTHRGGGRPQPPQSPPRSPPEQPESPTPGKPDKCSTSIDAIAVIRRELFIFKGKYFWRMNEQGLKEGYPVKIDLFWFDLPADLEKIDAVYERPDQKIAFFIGRQYWLFNSNKALPGYPRPLTNLGLPASLSHVDAAMVWGHNGKTYFFSGEQYWRYDEFDASVELDYPRHIRMWRGVPRNVDAAFQYTDGQTYFFKGQNFWRFNDRRMHVYNRTQHVAEWFGCPVAKPSYADEHSALSNDAALERLATTGLLILSAVLVLTLGRRS